MRDIKWQEFTRTWCFSRGHPLRNTDGDNSISFCVPASSQPVSQQPATSQPTSQQTSKPARQQDSKAANQQKGAGGRGVALRYIYMYPPPCLRHELECLGSLHCCSESSFSLDFLNLRDHTPRYSNPSKSTGSIGDAQKPL